MTTKARVLACFCVHSLLLFGCSTNAVPKPDIIQDAEAFTRDGIQAFEAADRQRAKQLFNQALSIYRGIDNQKGLVETHINLAEVALSEREYRITQQHLQKARAFLNPASLEPHQARVTLLYAQTALQQKQYTQAQRLLQALLPKFENTAVVTVPDTIQLTAIANRTKIAFAQAQDKKLWTYRYANALSASKQIHPSLTGRLLRFQAKLAQDEQKFQHAETLFQQALIEYKKDLARTGIAATLSELGQLHIAQGRWQDAQNYLHRTEGVLRSLNDRYTMIQVVKSLVKVETKLGNLESSEALSKWLAGMKSEVKGANSANSMPRRR